MTDHRLWRTFGALALANIALTWAALGAEGMSPELGSSREQIEKGLMQGSMPARFGGGYVEALASPVFLFAALLLARLLRGGSEWTKWLASGIGTTAAINVASALVVGFPAGAAAMYDGHHGASVEMVAIVNDVRNYAFFLSVAVLGVFTASVGAAVLAARALPRWLGWTGLAVGVVCVVSVAGARQGSHNLASLAQMVWWVALGVAALRVRRPVAAAAPREAVPA